MTATLNSTFYGNVQGALRTALHGVAGVPADDHWALENRLYTPAQGEPWLRWTFRPQPNRVVSIGYPNALVRHLGGALIDYFLPRGQGTSAADTFASAVVTAFRPGQYLTYNGQLVILRSCFVNGGMDDGQWYMRPITLGWTADTLTP